MGNNHIHHTKSALEKFPVSFEYNQSWKQAKQDVRKRTDSK